MNNILILGGTGFVGSALCEKLVERSGGGGGASRVPTRRSARGAATCSCCRRSRSCEADVHDDAQLARLVAGRDAVINLVAILHGSEAEFERAHAALPRRLAAGLPGGRRAPRGARQRARRRCATRRRCTCAPRRAGEAALQQRRPRR